VPWSATSEMTISEITTGRGGTNVRPGWRSGQDVEFIRCTRSVEYLPWARWSPELPSRGWWQICVLPSGELWAKPSYRKEQ
jgi:hypothetical protein